MSGTLYVVATPLGNLDDLAPRAVEALQRAALIACEDTRHSAKLLARCEIKTPTVSCHRFNEQQRLDELIGRLRAGDDLALVSDGGTPGVSDPGALLVRSALDAGVVVVPIPGPSAVASALSVSGMTADRYVFDGFLPHRAGERRRRLRALRDEPRTLVIFESPHRIRDSLADIVEVLGDRPLMLAREMTKLHETIVRGSAREVREGLGDSEPRGEITLVIAGASDSPPDDTDARAAETLAVFGEELARSAGDRRAALKLAARRLGLRRPELQRLLDELGPDGSAGR